MMLSISEASKVLKDDGSEGYVLSYDPNQRSFKQAMISIVFTGMWLEAVLHQEIVSKHGVSTFRKYDFKSYRDKLALLGVTNVKLLEQVDSFKSTRKELVHEKAYFDAGLVKVVQREADLAQSILQMVSTELGLG